MIQMGEIDEVDGRDDVRRELDSLYEWARRNVDYLTEVCLGPVTRGILERWEEGSDEKPWQDARPEPEEETSEEGQAA